MTKNTTKTNVFLLVLAILGIVYFSLLPAANAGFLDWAKNLIEIDNREHNFNLAFLDSQGTGLTNRGLSQFTLDPVFIEERFLSPSPFLITGNIGDKTEIKNYFITREIFVSTSAYSSTIDQTDHSPFITALGTQVRDGIVAANFLPFKTKIKIPEIFGDKIFVVEDRMNKRYWEKIDIWFPDRESALNFGVKTLKVQLIES